MRLSRWEVDFFREMIFVPGSEINLSPKRFQNLQSMESHTRSGSDWFLLSKMDQIKQKF